MTLEIRKLCAGYGGERVLENINLTIADGEFVSVLGKSGCGKSTLLGALAGTVPYEGAVLCDGFPLCGPSETLIYMPQDDLLFPWLTVLENALLYPAVHGKKRENRERAMRLLREFGLSGYERRYPSKLSGGQRQRVAFARTALSPAAFMLLDEPFAALDPVTRSELRVWLQKQRSRLGKSAIFVTHDIDEAIEITDRVLVLRGRPAALDGEFRTDDPKARVRIFEYLHEK
ncbi:MAG: ABC transporter ATP-binding protein [Clostridiales bacterium]|nr:ABC transporter ATP-binding protein [Clostridiales bacterium]